MTTQRELRPTTDMPHPPSHAIRNVLTGFGGFAAIALAATIGTLWRSNQPLQHYQRGQEALKSGNPEVTRREAEYLLQIPEFEPQGRLLKGQLLARSGRYGEALTQLEPASRYEETVVEASTCAASCLYALGQFLQAIDAAHAALERDPGCLEARRWLAASYYDVGAISNAIVELQKISEDDPMDARPDRLLGLIAKDGEHYKTAIEHYQKSLQRDPAQPERQKVLLELAESQIGLSRFEDAMMTLKEVEPSAIRSTNEASCYSGLGRPDEALKCLNEALKQDPRYFPAKLAVGKIYADTDNAEQAVHVLREAIEIEPHSSKVHMQLSLALRQLGRADEADDELRQMLEIQAMEREFTDLHDQADRQPSDAEIRYRLGEVAQKLGKIELARMWFRAVLAFEPEHAKSKAALRELK